MKHSLVPRASADGFTLVELLVVNVRGLGIRDSSASRSLVAVELVS
jgi:hypothetical protein